MWDRGCTIATSLGLALRRLEKDLADGKREQVMTDLDHELRKD